MSVVDVFDVVPALYPVLVELIPIDPKAVSGELFDLRGNLRLFSGPEVFKYFENAPGKLSAIAGEVRGLFVVG